MTARLRAAALAAALAGVLAATVAGPARATTAPPAAGETTATAATARAVPPREHICFSPDGTELNSFLGITDRIVGPPDCREAFSDETLYRSFPSWGTAQPRQAGDPPLLYPSDYTTSLPDDPMSDFRAKLLGVRIVQDIGTRRERTYSFGPEVLRRTSTDQASGFLFASFAAGPLDALSIGRHTSTVFMRLSAEHCDGLSTVREDSCLPAGEFPYTPVTRLQIFPPSAGRP
ncbi:hypothetical protein ABZO31_14920 [Streptomyces sp. HUAS MG47]|uniref:hypothetical protein n=1 Tax=Streptomyces solicamelliae TaxID=3231716 RepID=UPI0038781292